MRSVVMVGREGFEPSTAPRRTARARFPRRTAARLEDSSASKKSPARFRSGGAGSQVLTRLCQRFPSFREIFREIPIPVIATEGLMPEELAFGRAEVPSQQIGTGNAAGNCLALVGLLQSQVFPRRPGKLDKQRVAMFVHGA